MKKALYGLKESPGAWHERLDTEMSILGFRACKSDAGVYVRRKDGEEPMYVLAYVDDFLKISKDLSQIEQVEQVPPPDQIFHS